MADDNKNNLESTETTNEKNVVSYEVQPNVEINAQNDTKNDVTKIDDDFVDDVYKNDSVDLYKLEGLDVKDQSRVFSLVLTHVYKDYSEVDYSSIRKSALKCLKLSCDPVDDVLHLPYKLIVTKKGNKMYFEFKDQTKKNVILFLIILGLFIFAAMGSAYVALRYLSIAHLNIDIDGDGIADLNIDMNQDDKEEINISNDKEKPFVNIDYQGNRQSVFNIDSDGDGKPDKNMINQDINKDGRCDINCDLNGDGWPDYNIDLNGDGKVDLFYDTDDDAIADLNFDTTGNGKCDLHCDTDDDGVCDENCVTNVEVIETNTGSSALVGNNQTDVGTAQFIVDFVDSKQIMVDNLFPEDQSDQNVLKHVTKRFKIINKTTRYVRYGVELVVTKHTFAPESKNFVYKIESTNSGFNQDFTEVPRTPTPIIEEIVIPPLVTQEYTFTFKLNGINANQNFDQGRTFSGYFQVYTYDL